jgi:hypothetical protein
MSTLIRVEEVEPIEIGLILPDVSNALRLILGLAFNLDLVAVDRFQERTILPESYCIKPENQDLIGIKCLEGQAIVSVGTHEDKKYAYISPDGWRTALERALAAAVAIALAEYSASEISDSALAYTQVFSQSSQEFAQALKPEEDRLYYDVEEAAEAFITRLSCKRSAASRQTLSKGEK